MTIQLPPSEDTSALAAAIRRASREHQPLVLLPGLHFTKPGRLLKIPLGPGGLTLTGEEKATIKRPSHAIAGPGPNHPSGKTDDNYGLFLVPAKPTAGEIADAAQWRRHTQPDGKVIEFIILMRGKVSLSGVTLDCNMGSQGAGEFNKNSYQHSAMLGISGARYKVGVSPEGLNRFAYVGFDEVRLDHLTLLRGGFSDDIWFAPGGFRPNISQVKLSNLVSRDRVSPIRASVEFSGLSQRVSISDCKLDELHNEVDSRWSELPGPPDLPVEQSAWDVKRIQAANVGFSVKGDAQTLTGSRLNVTRQFYIHRAAGSLADSRLAVRDENRIFDGLRDFHFRGCTWVFRPGAGQEVKGLTLLSRPERKGNPAHPFKADFTDNAFVVEGSFGTGQLIATGDHEGDTTALFAGCKYQSGFGTGDRPIARLRQRGKYSFKKADLAGLNPKEAVQALPKDSVRTTEGDFLVCSIP